MAPPCTPPLAPPSLVPDGRRPARAPEGPPAKRRRVDAAPKASPPPAEDELRFSAGPLRLSDFSEPVEFLAVDRLQDRLDAAGVREELARFALADERRRADALEARLAATEARLAKTVADLADAEASAAAYAELLFAAQSRAQPPEEEPELPPLRSPEPEPELYEVVGDVRPSVDGNSLLAWGDMSTTIGLLTATAPLPLLQADAPDAPNRAAPVPAALVDAPAPPTVWYEARPEPDVVGHKCEACAYRRVTCDCGTDDPHAITRCVQAGFVCVFAHTEGASRPRPLRINRESPYPRYPEGYPADAPRLGDGSDYVPLAALPIGPLARPEVRRVVEARRAAEAAAGVAASPSCEESESEEAEEAAEPEARAHDPCASFMSTPFDAWWQPGGLVH